MVNNKRSGRNLTDLLFQTVRIIDGLRGEEIVQKDLMDKA